MTSWLSTRARELISTVPVLLEMIAAIASRELVAGNTIIYVASCYAGLSTNESIE
jgi:hypothetical protein